MKNVPAMKALFLVSVLTLSIGRTTASDKIVGGVKVTDRTEAPYMVSLSESCGGSIISSKWILTAAHCVGYFDSVKGGILNLSEGGVDLKMKQAIKHPNYNRRTFSNDFALVELEEAIDFEKTGLRPVKLATPKFAEEGNQDEGLDSTVYGFGNIGERQENVAGDLNKVVVPIVSKKDANASAAYNGAVDDTMLPAGYLAGGKDSCQGDSGGPLVVFDHQNDPVQVGVVSWGIGCARRNKYGVYSKVSSGFAWIKEVTGL